MKHPLLTFRRSPWMTAVCLAIIALIAFPLLIAAVTADSFAGGTGAASLTAAGAFSTPFMLRNKADEHGDGGGGTVPDPATALAKLEDVTLPMSQRLSVAVQALKGIDPTNQLATIKTQLDEAKQTLATRDADVAKLQADIDTANKRIAALQTDVSDAQTAAANAEKRAKDLEAKEQDLSKRADSMAKERMRELGFKAADLPPSDSHMSDDVPATRADLEAAMEKLSTAQERQALLMRYRKAHAARN